MPRQSKRAQPSAVERAGQLKDRAMTDTEIDTGRSDEEAYTQG
jgi:hypothetical protein